MRRRPASATRPDTLFPSTTRFRAERRGAARHVLAGRLRGPREAFPRRGQRGPAATEGRGRPAGALPRVHRRCRAACAEPRLAQPGPPDERAVVSEHGRRHYGRGGFARSEEHTSEPPVTNAHLVCRLLLEKKNKNVEQKYKQ